MRPGTLLSVLGGDKKSVLPIKHHIKELFKTYFYGCSRGVRKKGQNLRQHSKNQPLEQRLPSGNSRKKPFSEFRSLLNAPSSTKAQSRRNRPLTKKSNASKLSFLKSQKKSVTRLKEKLSKLIKHKEATVISKSLKLEKTLKSLDDMYEKYSDLANEVLRAKGLEDSLFEEYINKCQEKEKAIVDVNLEISNQQTKIKLLHETLTKRSQEHSRLLNKNKELVCFPIITKASKIKAQEKKITETCETNNEYEKALQYEFHLYNSK